MHFHSFTMSSPRHRPDLILGNGNRMASRETVLTPKGLDLRKGRDNFPNVGTAKVANYRKYISKIVISTTLWCSSKNILKDEARAVQVWSVIYIQSLKIHPFFIWL